MCIILKRNKIKKVFENKKKDKDQKKSKIK